MADTTDTGEPGVIETIAGQRVELTDGSPVPADRSHTEDRGDGQQKGYIVLSPEERAKGFVRPLRRSYRHTGVRPKYPTQPLTDEQKARFGDNEFVAYEAYPADAPERPSLGRYWSDDDLKSGCGAVTTMGQSLAETYARDPGFYGGTFCATCGTHYPVGARGQFVWIEPDGSDGPRVGT